MSDTAKLNSKHAWREIAGHCLPKRSAHERAADFLEIYGLYDEATAREQASRCIQCPNPSCVNGCPLCNPIPQWLLLTAEGRFLEAAAVLGSVTNMAEICARVCPSDHLCEGACLLEGISTPVEIQALEQFLIDFAFAHNAVDASTAPPNGLKVAVVGSGPGGLACAEELARKGFSVTVLDAELVPGGLLVNGTPAFKVDKSLVQRRLDILRKRGVKFQLGVKLWQDLTLEQLRSQFDAVFLGWDARKARKLDIPGSDLRGVVPAVPFLLQKNTPIPLDLPPIDVAGKKVVVLGGGDTAMDCLRAAIRYGGERATCIYRREQADMPCGRHEYENALEEGAQFIFQAAPVELLPNQDGWVSAVRVARTELKAGQTGSRRSFAVMPGSEYEVKADWVIPALGFEPVGCPPTDEFRQLKLNSWGGIVVDANQMTSLPGVFAGGDIVSGPGLILHAVRDARRAAVGITSFLKSKQKAPASQAAT
jgi:glutamate synthase (NADPH/NADH) small chain